MKSLIARIRPAIPFLCALPCVLAGTTVMRISEIPTGIYIRGPICLLVCGILSAFYLCGSKPAQRPHREIIAAAMSVLLLSATLLCKGADDVHRWIIVGPISSNIAFIVLPVLICCIARLLQPGTEGPCFVLILCAAAVLFLQPDASMLTALAVSLIPFRKQTDNRRMYAPIVVVSMLAAIRWLTSVSPAPVPHTEGILSLARGISPILFLLCFVAFAIALLPFLPGKTAHPRGALPVALCLFHATLFVCSLSGDYPVPMIGYGLSPIVGYMLSASYILRPGTADTHEA